MCSDFILIVTLFVVQVGDIVSVIDMPPKEDTGWWRGKHGFQVNHLLLCVKQRTMKEELVSSLSYNSFSYAMYFRVKRDVDRVVRNWN